MKSDLETSFDAAGPIGSTERLVAIANANISERSEAARRVLEKRERRLELINSGLLTCEEVAVIVRRECQCSS